MPKPLTVQCPKCLESYELEVNIGARIQCPCDHRFRIGEEHIVRKGQATSVFKGRGKTLETAEVAADEAAFAQTLASNLNQDCPAEESTPPPNLRKARVAAVQPGERQPPAEAAATESSDKGPEARPLKVKKSAPKKKPPSLAGKINTKNADRAVESLSHARGEIIKQISRVVIGQEDILNQILVSLFANGHCLLVGVPGLAKTLLVNTLGQATSLESKRIQFTPDLMPTDITGMEILDEDSITRKREFRFNPGPLFTNLLLADEINRTPPKTQAALLQAMQERIVTVGGTTYELPKPFLVLATQNPIEQEGTYALPEAQLDRFMFCLNLTYPELQDEHKIILQTTGDFSTEVEPVIDSDAILQFQSFVRRVPVSDHVALYAINLVRATRPEEANAPDFVSKWLRWGAGTRAGQYLLLAAKSHAVLNGQMNVSCADVRKFALPVLRHRIFCNFAAASEGIKADDVIRKIVEEVKEPAHA